MKPPILIFQSWPRSPITKDHADALADRLMLRKRSGKRESGEISDGCAVAEKSSDNQKKNEPSKSGNCYYYL
jgi:hypothetical protein